MSKLLLPRRSLIIGAPALLLAKSAAAQVGLPFPGPGHKGSGASVSGWAGAIPQSGLVHAWPFDTTYTTTSTGNDPIGGANAAFTSVTLNGSGPTTKLNNAAVFNGTNSIGPIGITNPIPFSTFSIALWANPVNGTGGGLFNNSHSDADNTGFETSYNGFGFQLGVGNSATFKQQDAFVGSPAGVWTFCVWTYDGSTITGYNGAANLQGSTAIAGPMVSGTNTAAFGYNPSFVGNYFNGKLAGCAIYNRVLTTGEITTIYGT